MPDAGRSTGDGKDTGKATMGVDEARSYLDAFTSLQLWVLSLPDNPGAVPQVVDNPLKRAQALIKGAEGTENKPSLAQVMEELAKPPVPVSDDDSSKDEIKNDFDTATFHLPPSAKPELLSVAFALLVHTYCELLEVGMESTAHCLRDAFKPIYEPLFTDEFRDLMHCTTTEDTMRLNSHNSQHMEALNALKSILVQVASYQLRREELYAQSTATRNSNSSNAEKQKQALEQKIKEYDRSINILKQKYNELSQRASTAFDKMHDLPFLRRARAVRWQLTLSNATYGLLTSFLNQSDDSLLAMSTLLQTKCELHVERRDPLPFTPACVLEDVLKTNHKMIHRKGEEPVPAVSALDLNLLEIRWAAPAVGDEGKVLKLGEKLPYPKFKLDEEYDTTEEAARAKKIIEFNRALLINGFRRLEALEKKRSYEVLPLATRKRVKGGDTSVLTKPVCDPLAPSILLTSLASNVSSPLLMPPKKPVTSSSRTSMGTDATSIWEEAGIGICCGKLCEPDGRRIAIGCDDASVRIYDVTNGKGNEPTQVLLGHKNGFSVFGVDWNQDGRCLLSAGGDGSVRLWDTMAVGPFGEVATLSIGESNTENQKTVPPPAGPVKIPEGAAETPDMSVPGIRPETAPYSSGAALAVYRGHVPSAPVWSVSFSPSGYYFATAAADATARIWTTDRTIPVRLCTGHTASNVNCVEWHPNCNYIITGSDDKTCRLWDIQTGRTVRLLSGSRSGINAVKISPNGRYAVGADYSGIVTMWDLGSGRKVTEIRAPQREKALSAGNPMVHALTFSPCSTALATGGDDCCVRVWDIRSDSLANSPVMLTPAKALNTKRSLLLDLQFTKRNLLLGLGKVITPVPLAFPDQ